MVLQKFKENAHHLQTPQRVGYVKNRPTPQMGGSFFCDHFSHPSESILDCLISVECRQRPLKKPPEDRFMLRIASLALALVLIAFPLYGQLPPAKEQPLVDIRQLMSASEFSQSGLDKLSAEELRKLNLWLTGFSMKLITAREITPDVVESRIEGDFEGWDGDTIFKLDNGQIWQQDSYAYTYHYAYRPKVLIFKSSGRYKMKVDGVSGEITVKRIK
jgi:hypothetical protein